MTAVTTAVIDGVSIKYDVVGRDGPWVSYMGGGRSDLEAARPLATLLADGGYRVLIHDRRNTGASDFAFDRSVPEQVSWADDLYRLLVYLDALPVFVGGASAGCRVALLLAARHPDSVSGIFVSRPSGGEFAARYLAESNYDEWLEAADRGGMAGVCDLPSVSDSIRRNPTIGARLLAMDSSEFVGVVESWRRYFSENGHLTLMGLTDEELSQILPPVCIIAGQDDLHPRSNSERFHQLVPDSSIHYLHSEEDVEALRAGFPGPYATIQEQPEELASVYLEFLDRLSGRRA
jgi:pimeloyl-ACP methyl ester carboxylesterase